jgi:hypothetical protein
MDMRTTNGDSLALLQTGLAGLDGADPGELEDGQVRSEVAALLVAANQLMAVLSARVGVFDARGLAEVDGFKTTRSWLVAFGRMSQGAATRGASSTRRPRGRLAHAWPHRAIPGDRG